MIDTETCALCGLPAPDDNVEFDSDGEAMHSACRAAATSTLGKMVQPGEAEAVAWRWRWRHADPQRGMWHITPHEQAPHEGTEVEPLYPASALSAAYARGVGDAAKLKEALRTARYQVVLLGGDTDTIQLAMLEVIDAALLPDGDAPSPSDGWNYDMDAAPRNTKLLVAYQNELGKWRVVTGCYHTQLPWSDDYELEGDDAPEYAPEGWYEESDSSETIYPTASPPTAWRPLPAPPKGGQS